MEREPSLDELRALAARLARAVGANLVVLFGSRARGEGRVGSDVDLLYIVPDGADLLALGPVAEMALRPRPWPVDLVPMRESHWKARASVLARQVAAEGIVLYAA
ncbi:MAG: nucleotidyltransferase domain-containing protein [Acidobacteria bacterium]|nr:nucleotidyltransferase domain-containing protein [Acidobacteriota bacterium]